MSCIFNLIELTLNFRLIHIGYIIIAIQQLLPLCISQLSQLREMSEGMQNQKNDLQWESDVKTAAAAAAFFLAWYKLLLSFSRILYRLDRSCVAAWWYMGQISWL